MTKKACSSGRSIELEDHGTEGAVSLVIRFPFEVGIVAQVRGLPGRRFDPFAKCWRVPTDAVVEVIDALVPRSFQVEPAVRALYIERGGALEWAPDPPPAPEVAGGKLPPPRCRTRAPSATTIRADRALEPPPGS